MRDLQRVKLRCACSRSSLHFGRSRAFEQLSVDIDLERRYESRDASHFEEMTLETGAEAEHRSLSRLWELGARRLTAEIDKLLPEDRALALSVLLADGDH